jgi:hypothetical protein
MLVAEQELVAALVGAMHDGGVEMLRQGQRASRSRISRSRFRTSTSAVGA